MLYIGVGLDVDIVHDVVVEVHHNVEVDVDIHGNIG